MNKLMMMRMKRRGITYHFSETSSAFPLIIFLLIQLSPSNNVQQFLVFLRSFGRELAIVARAIQLNCCGKQKAPSSLSLSNVTRIRGDRISSAKTLKK